MSDATDRYRARLRVHVISPLPLAVGLLTGAVHAETTTASNLGAPGISGDRTPAQPAYADHATTAPIGLRGYSAGATPKQLANGLPTCTLVDDTFVTTANTEVSGNVRNNDGPSGSSAPVASATQGAHGTVSMDTTSGGNNGEFDYTPNQGFSGTDSFTYAVEANPPDCRVVNSVATVTITVSPLAVQDTFATSAGKFVSGDVLSNDVGSNLSVIGNTQPAHGTANVAADGNFVYVPQPNFTGTDSFQYTLEDGSGDEATGSVTLQVAAAAPVVSTPAASSGALGLLASLLAWFGLRRRRED